jgi:hypothetical protein
VWVSCLWALVHSLQGPPERDVGGGCDGDSSAAHPEVEQQYNYGLGSHSPR